MSYCWPRGHPLMNDMKQPWDAGTGWGGGMMEDRWQQPTHGPHLWWAQPAPGKGLAQMTGSGDRCAHMHTGYVWRCQNTQPPTKHLQSEDILSKGCVYCRINHQLFHYIIHVLSRPHLYPRASYSFFLFFVPSHLPLTLTLILGSCTDTNPSDNSA